MVADQELQLGTEQAHTFGPRPGQRGQIGHQARIHVQPDRGAAQRRGGQFAERGIAALRLGLHGDLVAEGGGDAVFGAQMGDALIAVDQDRVAVQRLGRDAFGMDHQRNDQRARHHGGVGPDRAFLKHDPFQLAAIVQQFGRADVARDKDRVGGHVGAGIAPLSGQKPQKPVRQIVKVVQAVAQIGVGDGFKPGAGGGLFLFHRRLGRQAAADILFHPPDPAARMGEHAVSFQHLALFGPLRIGERDHVVDRHPQLLDRRAQPFTLCLGVVADHVGDDDAGFVQPDMALGRAFLPGRAAEHHRMGVQRAQRLALADEGAKLGHLGQHHGDDFQRIDLIVGILPCVLGLDDENAQLFAQPLNRHAKEGGIDLFPRLRHVAETAFRRGVAGVDRGGGFGDAPDQAFAQPHPRLVDRFLLQALGRAKLKRLVIAEKIDGTDLRLHRIRDQVGDAVQPFLPLSRLRKRVPQAPEELATFAFRPFGHDPP